MSDSAINLPTTNTSQPDPSPYSLAPILLSQEEGEESQESAYSA